MKALALVVALAGTAGAEPAVDWERGLVIERAIGTADRRAPSPAVARVTAEREAADRAAAALLVAGKALPGAGAADLASAVITLDTENLPDGSVRMRRGLPIEAIRQASAGARVVAPDWDGVDRKAKAPAPLIVDARNLEIAPRVGIAVTDGTTTASLPAIWVRKAPKGKLVKATRYDEAAGALVVDAGVPADGGALLVVVIRE